MPVGPAVQKLGVGLAYQPAMRPFIEAEADRLGYLEVVPDILWTDRGSGHTPRYVDDPDGVGFLRQMRAHRTVVPHGIGLSIGSAHRFKRAHLDQLKSWHQWLDFPWHSDHLAFNLAEHGIDELNVGVTVPLPMDRETLEALEPRIAEVRGKIPVPFALENNVYFFDFDDAEYDDAGFLNALTDATGCSLVLDLHNVYVNSRNHGGDPFVLLGRLNLERVIELHVAVGLEHDGYYLDAHSGPLPATVWRLLERALPHCPNLGGVTFELLGSWYHDMGAARLIAELDALQEMWSRHQPVPERIPA